MTLTVVKVEEGEIPSQLDDQTLEEIEELMVMVLKRDRQHTE